MTEEQKELLISKMLDRPASLSDEELDAMLHDDELRDIYEVSAAVSSACTSQPELDMAEEWKRFKPRIRRKPTATRWIMRVAVIFLGVIFVSGIVNKLIDNLFTSDRQPVTANAEQPKMPVEPEPPQQLQQRTATKNIAQVKRKTSKYHTFRAAKKPANAQRTNLNRAATREETEMNIDEYLRIQQARIDNELAIQAAESYIDEYDELLPILDAAQAYSPELDNEIRKVTME